MGHHSPVKRLVTISFYLISIDDPGDCVHNYLILYDGPDANSPSSGLYCGAVRTVMPTGHCRRPPSLLSVPVTADTQRSGH
ncbi:Cubilin [Manis javanica]|nr:Cubilin [Manis javanica]